MSMRVVEFSDELGGIAGEVLATFGDTVTRVLLPGQSADPVRDGVKLLQPAGTDPTALIGDADLVIDGLGPGGLAGAGVDLQRARAANPALVVARVSWFGHDGPYAHFRGADILAQALGGTLGICGPADGSPVLEPEDAARFQAELALVAGALAARRTAARTGTGEDVDVSVHETAASRLHRIAYQFDGVEDRRGILDASIWRLADGYASLTLSPGSLGAPGVAALVAWMREVGVDPGLLGERAPEWKSVQYAELRAGGLEAAIRPLLRDFLATRAKAEFHHRTVHLGVQGAVIRTPGDVLTDDHLAVRGFWTERDGHPAPGRYAGISTAGLVEATGDRGEGDLPLAGVRVLDFCWAIAGSGTTVQLAQLGAEVIRVETTTRPDLARTEVQVSVSRPDSFDDKPWAANLNIAKKSIRLDMRHPGSREVLTELVRWADLVTENFRPGTLAKLGWSDEVMRGINPAVIIAKGSMAGQSGPLSTLWGIDTTGRALAGRVHLTGEPGRPPVSGIGTPAPYGDVVVPYIKVAAIQHALARREQTGEVTDIDISMLEVLVQQIAGAVHAAARGTEPERRGNRDAVAVPQGVFPVAGEDRWIAISVRSDDEWAALAEVAGDQLDRPQWRTAAGRRADEDALESALAAWTRDHDGRALMERLQAWGVRAGYVQTTGDVSDRDPQLRHRGFLGDIEHPILGVFGHSTLPYKFSRTALVRTPAPALGEHTRDTMTRIVGMDDATYDRFDAEGLFR